MSEGAKWYVVHTYSGYENKVAADIEKAAETRRMTDLIQAVSVPLEKVVEIKDNKRKEVERKMFPGYVLVKMIITDESWYVVRNTRGVTGFVGPGSKPVPLSESEILSLGVEKRAVSVDYDIGDPVRILDGALASFSGYVEDLNIEKNYVKVSVSMLGRALPVELELDQVERAEQA
ncbi:MAG: transcription termination/antitermination protein NusG [Clostridia bacterium]|nr:transcription termination/antitermination protein NusG [Clostridia bacterium]